MASAPEPQLSPGQRVTIWARPFQGRRARIIRPARLLWNRMWLVELEEPSSLAINRRTRVRPDYLEPCAESAAPSPVNAFAPGRTVVVRSWPFYGRRARLIRPSRQLLERVWLVEFEEPTNLAIRNRTRLAPRFLELVDEEST